jgi:hypothetical protein
MTLIGFSTGALALANFDLALTELERKPGHARQFDTTMTEAYRILQLFADRLCQVHVSEVNSASQHDRLSYSAVLASNKLRN